jgi:hypothetical protein
MLIAVWSKERTVASLACALGATIATAAMLATTNANNRQPPSVFLTRLSRLKNAEVSG